ncbi:hypothetical protein HY489_03790 [Candidatus Woesearchaeota archaeon]|nr:hypothetical protein [Candidatus Woesearchaeota archaeon]
MSFKCHGCGHMYVHQGLCKSCNKPLERACPSCGFGKDFCTCEVASTKEGLKR